MILVKDFIEVLSKLEQNEMLTFRLVTNIENGFSELTDFYVTDGKYILDVKNPLLRDDNKRIAYGVMLYKMEKAND